METIFAEIDNYLNQNRRLVLARIIRQVGIAPRRMGTRCLIIEDGTLIGTIGGGRLEHEIIEKAKHILHTAKTVTHHFSPGGTEVTKTGMLCGGIADVYLEPLFPENRATGALFAKIAAMTAEGRTGSLLTAVADGIRADDTAGRLLIDEDGKATGDIGANIKDALGDSNKYLNVRSPVLRELVPEEVSVFVEPIRREDTLYLFGAGHVSTFVAPLATTVGFRVAVIDDRKEFANRERFPAAADILVVPYTEAFKQIRMTSSSYLVIATRGHRHDLAVLRRAVDGPCAYLGMIGSRRKIQTIFDALRQEGVSESNLKKVHAPIGLDIGADTPEEIAVSILAELIQARNG
jgi:xanthine dehydrogenase accessory factor